MWNVGDWVAIVAAGTGTPAIIIGFFRWLVTFTTQRMDVKQARLEQEHSALDAGWKAYRETLEKDVASLRTEVGKMRDAHEECMARNHALESKVANLQGYVDGKGQVMQEAAQMVAAERLFGEERK